MIKHFFKWLKLVPLLDHNSEGVAYAFFNMVFIGFGVLVKVFTDQSIKYHGEFQELCEKTLIDHHVISWNHPKGDKLVEWMVQMVKWGLWKYGFQKAHIWNWDLWLELVITMASYGYRFSW